MNIEDIRACEAPARKEFTYTPDGQQDTWRSHADDVVSGRPWQGDCDDLASTVLDLCGHAGAPRADRYFLVVMSTNGGHAVGCVFDSAGVPWIVGDTFEFAPYPAATMKHQPIDYHRQSEAITEWRKGIPWSIQT